VSSEGFVCGNLKPHECLKFMVILKPLLSKGCGESKLLTKFVVVKNKSKPRRKSNSYDGFYILIVCEHCVLGLW